MSELAAAVEATWAALMHPRALSQLHSEFAAAAEAAWAEKGLVCPPPVY